MATLPSRVPLICPLRIVVLIQPAVRIAATATTHPRPPTCLMRSSLYADLLDDHKSASARGGNVSILARVQNGAGCRHADVRVAIGEQVGGARKLTGRDQRARRRETGFPRAGRQLASDLLDRPTVARSCQRVKRLARPRPREGLESAKGVGSGGG